MPTIIDPTGNPGIAPPISPVPRLYEVDVIVFVNTVACVLVAVPIYEVEVDVTVPVLVTGKVVVAVAVAYVVPETVEI